MFLCPPTLLTLWTQWRACSPGGAGMPYFGRELTDGSGLGI